LCEKKGKKVKADIALHACSLPVLGLLQCAVVLIAPSASPCIRLWLIWGDFLLVNQMKIG